MRDVGLELLVGAVFACLVVRQGAASTIPLYANDIVAFNQMSQTVSRSLWKDCNSSNPDPCAVCSSNTGSHAVVCATTASSPTEKRITGFIFRNLDIQASVDEFDLTSFTALETVDFSSVLSEPWANVITLPFGQSCISLALCFGSSAICNFGPLAPLCSSDVTPAPTSPPSGDSLYVLIGAGAGAGLLILAAFILFLCCRGGEQNYDEDYSRSNKKEKKQRQREKSEGSYRDSRDADSSYRASSGSLVGQQLQMQMPPPMYQPQGPPSQMQMPRGPGPSSPMQMPRPPMQQPPRQQQYNAPAVKPRKSFTSLRTRTQKATNAPSESNAESSATGPARDWVEQYDYTTGRQYWLNPSTGAVTYEHPNSKQGSANKPSSSPEKNLRSSSSSKKIIQHGSSKKLVKHGSVSGSSQKLNKAGSSKAMSPASMSSRNMMPPPGFNPGGQGPRGPGAGPGGWEQVYDGSTDSTYWVDHATGQLSYTSPFSN